jgi:hypothetical protein
VSSAEPGLRLHEEPHLDSDPLRLVGLTRLFSLTEGASSVAIGLVDGPVALDHPNLSSTNIHELSGNSDGRRSDVTCVACMHGTFMAGILSAKRGSAVPAICPGCTLSRASDLYGNGLPTGAGAERDTDKACTGDFRCGQGGRAGHQMAATLPTDRERESLARPCKARVASGPGCSNRLGSQDTTQMRLSERFTPSPRQYKDRATTSTRALLPSPRFAAAN